MLGIAPTGSGKTLTFILPILCSLDVRNCTGRAIPLTPDPQKPSDEGFRAIVLSPTRELAKQTHRGTRSLRHMRSVLHT